MRKNISARYDLVHNGIKYELLDDGQPISFRRFYQQMVVDENARRVFTMPIARCDFAGFFWETPPVTEATADDPFEFVVINGESLARLTPNARPFQPQFAANPDGDVVTFANLGGDARLVVPRPLETVFNYAHLGAFLRNAPAEQIDSFWKSVAEAVLARLSDQPVWVSTAGMGVSWLHVRLDNRPKYYRYAPYRGDFGRKSEQQYR